MAAQLFYHLFQYKSKPNRQHMKKSMLTTAVLISLFFTTGTKAQIGIGISNSAMNASAQLELSTTAKGFLPPRMTETQRNAISSPAAGLVVWCSNCGNAGEMQVYNGTAWTNVVGGTAAVALQVTIGQSYGGGKVAYILQSGDLGYDADVQHGLIAAAADQATQLYWGCYGSSIPAARFSAIGTGNQNTIAIMAACSQSSIAARVCGNLVLNGYSDWYLPSREELDKLYLNRVAIGGFTNNIYYSSTETDGNNACALQFTTGERRSDVEKKYDVNVRAVRSF
jgi:hypothetical protein